MKVFVYGTLKPGYYNHRVIEDLVLGTQYDEVHGFTLHDLGHFPAALPKEGGRVTGVVLTLAEPEEALRRLDRLEGAPRLYRREEVTTKRGDKAWFYVFNQPTKAPDSGHVWPTPNVWPIPNAPEEPEPDEDWDCEECEDEGCEECEEYEESEY